MPIESTIFRKPTKLVSLGRWAGGTSSSDCTLCHRPVLGSGGILVFRSLGFRGNHFSCGHPELNILPWGSFSGLSPTSLAQSVCSLCPALYSLQHASSFLGEPSPGGQRSCQGGKDPTLLAWAERAARLQAVLAPPSLGGCMCPLLPLARLLCLSSLSCCSDHTCCLACRGFA